jgi:golgin subfamily A member 4
VQRKEKDSC